MRKRTLLVVVPLVVVALVAGVAVAAPSDGQQASDAKLDNLHARRPIAASPEFLNAEQLQQMFDAVTVYVHALEEEQFNTWLGEVAAFLDSLAEPPPAGRGSGRAAPAYSGGVLSCIKQRESHGDYTVHNSQGSGASGAYQFMPGTWNSIAASEGRHDLVGVDPAAASPSDQDAMAAALYAQRGSAPWGGAC